MIKSTRRIVTTLGLAALPLLFVVGCSGGSGGSGLGGSPTPTSTPLPPGEGYTINATFSNVNAPFVKSSFKATGGRGAFRPTAPAFLSVLFNESGEASRRLSLLDARDTELKAGDVITLSAPGAPGYVHTVEYVDFTHDDQTFVASGGTLKIVDLTRTINAAGGFFTQVHFELSNVTMIRQAGNGDGTGSFTINGSGFFITTKEVPE